MQVKKSKGIGTKAAGCILSIILLGLIFLFLPSSLARAANSGVTKQNIIDAILGNKTFTDTELDEMDKNSDGAVDVADLVIFAIDTASTGEIKAEFEESTSKAWEGDGSVNVTVNSKAKPPAKRV